MPIAHQGRRPTCLAFASSSAHEKHHDLSSNLCSEWLYYHAVQFDGGEYDSGTTVSAVRHVLQNNGQPSECFWPYSSTLISSKNWRPPSDTPTDLRHAGSLNVADAHASIVESLQKEVPTVIGLLIGSDFQSAIHPTGFEIISAETEPREYGAGHAVLCVGNGEYEGGNLLLIRNSWGPMWRDQGYAWLSEEYLRDRWIDGFSLKEV